MPWFDVVALWVGRCVLLSCGIGGAAVLSFFPINYAWRKWGDMAALLSVVKEARRQGRRIFGVKQRA